jgi:hypothetical protein
VAGLVDDLLREEGNRKDGAGNILNRKSEVNQVDSVG